MSKQQNGPLNLAAAGGDGAARLFGFVISGFGTGPIGLFMMTGAVTLTYAKGYFGGSPAGPVDWIGVGLFVLGIVMMHKLVLANKQGLLEQADEVRFDVLGQPANDLNNEPTLFDRILLITRLAKLEGVFEKAAMREVDAHSKEQFGSNMHLRFSSAFKDSEDPLLRGDLKTFFEGFRPGFIDSEGNLHGYAHLHVEVPDDIDIHTLVHDKLITGDDPSQRSAGLIKRKDLEEAYWQSLQKAKSLVPRIPLIAFPIAIGASLVLTPGVSYGWCLLTMTIPITVGSSILVLREVLKKALHARSVSGFAMHVVNHANASNTATYGIVKNYEDNKS